MENLVKDYFKGTRGYEIKPGIGGIQERGAILEVKEDAPYGETTIIEPWEMIKWLHERIKKLENR